MNALLKKIFTVGVVTTTIFWSFGITTLVQVAVANAETFPTLVAGQMVKVVGKAPIYVINGKGEALYYPTGDEFKSWFTDNVYKGKYTPITMAHFDTIKVPAVQPISAGYRPGSTLVKRESSDTLYVVQPGNTLAEIDAATASSLGYSTSKAFEVKLNAWGAYTSRANKITSAVAHPGMYVKVNNVTYYVDATNKLREVTAAALSANGVKPAVVHSLGASAISGLATGEKIDGVLAELKDSTQTGLVAVTPVVTGGSLAVSLASDTPAAGYAFASAARVPFTKVVFTAGSNAVKIDSFKVKRTGAAAVDADFSSINVVTPEGTLLNDSGKTLNSDHEVTFTEDITVPANSSKTYTLVGMMAAAAIMTAGNAPKLAVTEVVSDASSVSGLPVEGNIMTTNESLTLGTVTLTEGSSIGTVTKQVGATNVLLASIKVTNTGSTDTKSVKVERMQVYNSSTIADADISNLKLKFNGNVVASGSLLNKDAVFDLAGCTTDCTVEKGYDKTYDVYADLTGGSGRTIDLDVQYVTHVLIKDVNNNVYITPSYGTVSAAAMTNAVTVSQGKLNITKVDTVPAGNIPGNATSPLASWNFKVTGEPVDVRTLVFKVTTSSASGTLAPTGVDALVLYNAAGKALMGSVDVTGAYSPGYATTTDTFTLQPGDNILTLKGKIDSTAVANDIVTVSVDMANTTNFSARGVNSSLDITLGTYATPQSVVAANAQTIQTSALTVTTLSQPASTTYAAGTGNVLLAKIMLDAAASAEDIKVTAMTIVDNTGAAAKTIDIQSAMLKVDKDGDSYNGAGTTEFLTETVSGSDSDAGDNENFVFNLSGADQFTVKKGKKLVVELYGSISGGAATGSTAIHQFALNTANYLSATGLTSNTTVSESISASFGNGITVGTSGGGLAVSLASGNPSSKLVAAGTTVTLASFNFLATTTEDVELDYLHLTQLTTTAASTSYRDYDEIWFVNEAGQEVAGTRMSPTSTSPYIDFADEAVVIATADTDGVNLSLKGKLASIGGSSNGTSGHFLGYKITTTATDVVATGHLSGGATLEFAGGTAPSGNAMLVYKGYPSIEKLALSTNKLANGTMDLYKFKVTAVNSDVALYGFTFDVASTVATFASLNLYEVDQETGVETLVNDTTCTVAQTGSCLASANGAVWTTIGTDWTTNWPAYEITVSKTVPKVFVLKGTISSAGTSASVSVKMAGDSTHIHGTSALNVATAANVDSDASGQDDFIWSDKSAEGHVYTSVDFTNGYLVTGLSSTTSTGETISY